MSPVNPQVLMALSTGIQSEVAAYVFYVEAAKKSQAAQFKDVLEKLALEEKMHFQLLEGQHDSLVRSEKWISTADALKRPGLPEISEGMTERHKELIAEVQQAGTVQKILDIAYRLEEEAYEMFDSAANRSDSPEGKRMFGDLAKFEAGHMTIIKEMMKKFA
jgi:rubrerythrin